MFDEVAGSCKSKQLCRMVRFGCASIGALVQLLLAAIVQLALQGRPSPQGLSEVAREDLLARSILHVLCLDRAVLVLTGHSGVLVLNFQPQGRMLWTDIRTCQLGQEQ